MKTTTNRSRKGFTLIETMLVLVLIALAGAFIYPKVAEILFGGKKATAAALQDQLTNWYTKWTGVGGRHGTTAGQDVTWNLVTVMTSASSDTSANVKDASTGAWDLVQAGATASQILNSSMIRETTNRIFSKSSATVNGSSVSNGVAYDNQFYVTFTPNGDHQGTWSVVVADSVP